MITLGILLGKFITSNPRIVVMPTKKLEAGVPVEISDVKLSTIGEDKLPVIVLTI